MTSARVALVTVGVWGLVACSNAPKQLPPTIYSPTGVVSFEALAPELRSNINDVLYVTDRARADDTDRERHYSFNRSRSIGYGTATVNIAEDLSWEELRAWTTGEQERPSPGAPMLATVNELSRIPPTPYPHEIGDDGLPIVNPVVLGTVYESAEPFRVELVRRLELRPRNEVIIYVHGVAATFDDWVKRVATLDHLAGRQQVAIAYSWPAGAPGLIRAYNYDRESGEFTIYHFKQLVRFLASLPEVELIHFAAHSRGTDVVVTALQELIFEARAARHDPRTHLKLGRIAIVAPDLDMEVMSQRWVAEHLSGYFLGMTVYSNASDGAIGAAQNLFGGGLRVGQLSMSDVDELMMGNLHRLGNTDLVFYEGTKGGAFRHGYYQAPAVLADLVLMFAGRAPGVESGRPLEKLDEHIWAIDDDYLR